MSEKHKADGKAAFENGMRRSENPCDVSSEDWMDWMDGFDHARAHAEHPQPVHQVRHAPVVVTSR